MKRILFGEDEWLPTTKWWKLELISAGNQNLTGHMYYVAGYHLSSATDKESLLSLLRDLCAKYHTDSCITFIDQKLARVSKKSVSTRESECVENFASMRRMLFLKR